jgi:type VI secretion system secreted protein Hcp
MPISLPTPLSESVDAYLHVQTKKAGKVKGESTAAGQEDDIIVTGWSWGLSASSALATEKAERRSYTVLTVHKQIDRATTGLMSALATNDEVKEAKLTLRRAGGQQEVYFTVKLEKARIVSQRHETDADGHPRETLAIAFRKIEVEYTPQQRTGLRGGSTNFTDEIELP